MTNTVSCTNHLCGKEYHIDFAKCPFCGTENPQIHLLNEKIEQKRKAVAQKLESEKNLEKQSGGLYQSEYRLLVEGGIVEKAKKIIWKDIPIYVYIIGLISTIAFSIICTLALLPSYQNSEWLYWGLILSTAGFIFFLSRLLYDYLMNKNFHVRPANDIVPPSLGTVNSIGITCMGIFRDIGETHVSYFFVSLLVPIIPIGCYRVKEGITTSGKDGAFRKVTTPYKIYGSEKWNGLEILQIYLYTYSIAAFIGCTLWLLLTLLF